MINWGGITFNVFRISMIDISFRQLRLVWFYDKIHKDPLRIIRLKRYKKRSKRRSKNCDLLGVSTVCGGGVFVWLYVSADYMHCTTSYCYLLY